MNSHNFFAEPKRRNVYKVAVAYAVASWLLIQIATQVFPFFEIPNWAIRLVVLVLVLGFPVARRLVGEGGYFLPPSSPSSTFTAQTDGRRISHHENSKLVHHSVGRPYSWRTEFLGQGRRFRR